MRARYAAPHARAFAQAFLRGNGWGLGAMRLIGDNTWRIKGARFGAGGGQRFKFDVYSDWSRNFGDADGDGTADEGGADIPLAAGGGAYTVTFNDLTRRYSLARR